MHPLELERHPLECLNALISDSQKTFPTVFSDRPNCLLYRPNCIIPEKQHKIPMKGQTDFSPVKICNNKQPYERNLKSRLLFQKCLTHYAQCCKLTSPIVKTDQLLVKTVSLAKMDIHGLHCI